MDFYDVNTYINISERQCVIENPIYRIGRLSGLVGKLCKVDPDTNMRGWKHFEKEISGYSNRECNWTIFLEKENGLKKKYLGM